eukprot:GHVP01064002.1.p1 GENE.GHVP01064002.1~~GHVP01064002.1.p1  ORF type:complete len:197 (+),score=29.42 GHVP01064002.1:1-591(+)
MPDLSQFELRKMPDLSQFELRKMPDLSQFDMKKGELFQFSSDQRLIKIGLGWDYECGKQLDMDVSCVIFDKDSKFIDVVWFKNLNALNDSIKHSGDNLNGQGDGDDEVITVLLDRLPQEVHTLIFVINMYSAGTSFQDMSDFLNSEALIVAKVHFYQTRWEVQALGIPASGRTYRQTMDKIKEVASSNTPIAVNTR